MTNISGLIDCAPFNESLDLWKVLGLHSPVLRGSVPVSRTKDFCLKQLQALDLEIESPEVLLAKAFLYERICSFELSLHFAKKAASKASPNDFDCTLFLCKQYYYSGLNIQASLLVSTLCCQQQSPVPSSLIYWRSMIDGGAFLLNDRDALRIAMRDTPEILCSITNSLSASDIADIFWEYTNILSLCKLTNRHVLLYCDLLSRIENPDLSTIETIIDHLPNVRLANDYPLLCSLARIIGVKKTLELISANGIIGITSEVLALIWYFYAEPYSDIEIDRFVRQVSLNNVITDDDVNKFMQATLSDPFCIKDRNTSDGASRFYSLDYAGMGIFSELTPIFSTLLQEYYEGCLLPALKSSGLGLSMIKEALEESVASIWFDASYSYGNSKIEPHFHAAYPGCTYSATGVWYAKVPELHLGCGDLVIDFGGKAKTIRPVGNSVVFFPPWIFHGTTPTRSNSDIRLTFNFDRRHPTAEMPFSKLL